MGVSTSSQSMLIAIDTKIDNAGISVISQVFTIGTIDLGSRLNSYVEGHTIFCKYPDYFIGSIG